MKMIQSLLNLPGVGLLASHKIASVFGLMGVSITFTNFPMWLRIAAGIIGLAILVIVGLIKWEEYRTKRSDRLNNEDAHEIKNKLQDKASTIKGVDSQDIQDAFEETLD